MNVKWTLLIVLGCGTALFAGCHQGAFDPPPSPPGPANQEPSFIFQNEIQNNNPVYPY